MSQQIWTVQQAADYLEISKTSIEVAKSKKGEPTWLWELVDMLIPSTEKNLFYRDDVIRFANKIERQEHTRYLVLNILDEIVSKGLMTVDELAIFLVLYLEDLETRISDFKMWLQDKVDDGAENYDKDEAFKEALEQLNKTLGGEYASSLDN